MKKTVSSIFVIIILCVVLSFPSEASGITCVLRYDQSTAESGDYYDSADTLHADTPTGSQKGVRYWSKGSYNSSGTLYNETGLVLNPGHSGTTVFTSSYNRHRIVIKGGTSGSASSNCTGWAHLY